jgi:hypothetical protein
MIQEECFEKEWIDKVCSSHKFRHPELVEKVIRAGQSGGPHQCNGGTVLLLHKSKNPTTRWSDIIVLK